MDESWRLGHIPSQKVEILSKIEAQTVLNFQIFFHGLNHKAAKDFYTQELNLIRNKFFQEYTM